MAHHRLIALRLAVLGLVLAVHGRTQDQPAAPSYEEGLASWYGPSFDGMRAASGEVFDSQQLTAAHRTLPFGTWVRVRRLDSAESIVVRINDRGPYIGSRIIDLSYAAARRLGLTDPGLLRVSLEVVESAPIAPDVLIPHAPLTPAPLTPAPLTPAPLTPVPLTPAPLTPAPVTPAAVAALPQTSFAVQAGTFRDPENARRTHERLQEKFGDGAAVTTLACGQFWCVLVGNAATQAEAETLANAVRQSDLAYRTAFIVHRGQ